MASISDGLYTAGGNLMQMRFDLSKPLALPVMTTTSADNALCRVPEGMEQLNVWSSWRTGGNDKGPSNYPCAFDDGKMCAQQNGQECGRSLILRENSIWPQVTGSADGTGYTTTALLPPNMPHVQLGFCVISRKAIPVFKDIDGTVYKNYEISQLFLDGVPLLNYFSGKPFFFKTVDTPFLYMVPNAIMVKVSGMSYRVDTVSSTDRSCTCYDCM